MNFTKRIISPTISPIATSSKAFHVENNYNKKNLITYADVIHSDIMNRVKIQQKPLRESWNITWLMYLQIARKEKEIDLKKGH